ncbi:MAG: hypothetical protein Q9188_000917 [Gyalolechia gomerana]
MEVQKQYATAIEQQPITLEHKPYIPKISDRLIDAGTARATLAASKESPNGTTVDGYAANSQRRTVIQQHVTYWDRDNDNIIWPRDTYIGCHVFGWGVALSLFAAVVINIGLSFSTVPGILPDPFFRIYIGNLYKAKHGSDSMMYDNQGRFRPQQLEDIFAKHNRGEKGGLDAGDVWVFWKEQRMVFDLFGWTACAIEYVRAIYDGSIFYRRAEETKIKRSRTSPGLVAKAKKTL